ncbi:PTS sugar transporter subunit IIB [Kroppenstedtia pulmonis]|uniref:PTS sugar transporter subunit IIB n=1 Tax=Kroppenstedtia pulmonis TaxID=1380685 RepID=A0A7D3XH21_9BACL|nr:PTS sugar transporter subunit IIB [Kroppenstedtia pulmonis]QKG83244.1 PTS sugar transporter subunit IIB [Kroppenstedtia pulmonis]
MMKNILLCCSAGMSTSMLVKKMEKAAEEQGKSYQIKAVDTGRAKEELADAHVLLIGPQVKYLLSSMKEFASNYNVPVAVINPVDYGMCNGDAVLKQAEQLISDSSSR